MKELLKSEVISIGSFTVTLGDILNAAIIFITAWFLIKIISALITRIFKRKAKPDVRHYSIIQLVKYFVWTIAIVFILQALGININFIIASSAALLVGIGLGLQNVFKDFISGIILLIEGTIKVDDVVEVDGLVVQVNEVSIRTSKVTTREDNVVIIPNHKFIEDKIVNWTNNMLPSRFMIEVTVDYSSDEHTVKKILLESAASHSDVLNDKEYPPSVRLGNFGSASIDFQLIFYSYNYFKIESVKSSLRFHILDLFRKNKMVITFPQNVIHYVKKEQVASATPDP